MKATKIIFIVILLGLIGLAIYFVKEYTTEIIIGGSGLVLGYLIGFVAGNKAVKKSIKKKEEKTKIKKLKNETSK